MGSVELRHMRAFVAVAEELHFGRAARRLGLTQPALSRIVAELERAVGAPLMQRDTRNARLTEAGSAFLAASRATLAQSARAVESARDAASGLSGSVRLAFMEFAVHGLVPALVGRFRARYPEIRLTLAYMGTEQQRRALLDREIDVGFLIGPFGAPGLRSRVARRERLVALLPRRHPLAERRTLALTELAEEDFVLGDADDWGAFRRILEEQAARAGFAPRVVQEVPNAAALFGLVAAGLGVAVHVAAASRNPPAGVAVVPLGERAATLDTVAAWHEPPASPAVQRFIALLRGGDGAAADA